MKNFLALIRREDFDTLLKFGRIFISNYCSFDCDVKDLANYPDLLDSLMYNCNDFSYTFEYVLLHCELDVKGKKQHIINVDIAQCIGIYALDNDAFAKISLSVDKHVRFYPPIWKNWINRVKIERACNNSVRGTENLWRIMDFSEKTRNNLFPDMNFLYEFYRISICNQPHTGYLPIWTYLLLYSRHENYSNNVVGYFFDMVHILVNYIKKGPVLNIENTAFYKKFSEIDYQKYSFKDLFRELENNLPTLLSKIPTDASDFYKVAPIYLHLCDITKNIGVASGEVYENLSFENFIKKEMKIDKQSFYKAYYLLGIHLGNVVTLNKSLEKKDITFIKI